MGESNTVLKQLGIGTTFGAIISLMVALSFNWQSQYSGMGPQQVQAQQPLGSPTIVPDCASPNDAVVHSVSGTFTGPYYESYLGKYVKPDGNGDYDLDDCSAIRGALISGKFSLTTSDPVGSVPLSTPGAVAPAACWTPGPVTITGMTSASANLIVNPSVYMGPAFIAHAVPTATGSPPVYQAQVYVCNHSAATATPTPSAFNVRALQ